MDNRVEKGDGAARASRSVHRDSELVLSILRRFAMRSQAPRKGVLTTQATSTLGIAAYGNQGTSPIP